MHIRRVALARRRELIGFTQETLAARLGVTRATISHWERGSQEISVTYRIPLAEALQVSMAELSVLINPGSPPVVHGHLVPANLTTYESLVESAGRAIDVQTTSIPGLLQTEEYSTIIEREGIESVSQELIVARVRLRAARQRVLERQPDPLQLEVVLSELVLHNHLGDPAMMAAQLDHLVQLMARPNIEVRVLPISAALPSARGGFELLCKPGEDDPFIAYSVDPVRGSAYIDSDRTLADCYDTYQTLHGLALPGPASIERIHEVCERFHR